MSILGHFTSAAEIVTGDLPAGMTVNSTAGNLGLYVVEGVLVDTSLPDTPLNFTAAGEFWLDFYVYLVATGTTRALATIYSGSTALFRIIQNTSSTLRVEYWDGSAWQVGVSNGGSVSSANRYRIAAHIKMHDTLGVIDLYLNGALIGTSFAGDTIRTAATTCDKAMFQCPGSSGVVYSAVFASDEDSRPIHYIQRVPSGAGALTQMTGAYTDVDEFGFSDNDFLQAASADLVTLVTKAALPTALNTGYQVMGVSVSARALKGGTGPTKLQLACRHGTTNGFSGDKNLGAVGAPVQHMFTQNPATAAAWTFAEADAAQFGVKSIT